MIDRRQFQHGLGASLVASSLGLVACSRAGGPQEFTQLWSQLRGASVGTAASSQQLVVFFDTRCGYCTQLWHQLQPMQDKLYMLWAPVALLSPASKTQALHMLASDDSEQWLRQHMSGKRYTSSPASAPATPEQLDQTLSKNLDLMLSLPGSERSVPQSAGLKNQKLQVLRGAVPLPQLQSEFGFST